MGIRFACHACSKPLNIKQELAGKRGICPSCRCRFRIPLQDAPTSRPVDAPKEPVAAAKPSAAEILKTAPDPSPQQDESQHDESSPAASPVSSLDLLSSDPNATWYVRPPSGGQYGPASGEMLREWIDEGRVSTTSLLWRDGWPQWREATEAFPELAESLPASGDSFGYSDSSFSNKENDLDSLITETDLDGSGRGPRSTLSGGDRIGATRRARTNRRTMAIAGLASVAILLLVVLIVVATR